MQWGMAWSLVFSLLLASPVYSADVEPARVGQESFISRATVFHSQLWILTDSGELSIITEGGNEQIAIPLPEPALELWSQDGEPMVLTGEPGGQSWTMRQWSHDEWRTLATLSAKEGEQFLGVAPSASTVMVLTSARLIEIVGGRQHSLTLKWHSKNLGGITTITATGQSLLVGFNLGEWGGGLRRIDRATGSISLVERKSANSICSGSLNTDCDPVNGIAVEPWNPSCAVVAIGLVHFMAHGSIAQVCGDAVRRLYSSPYGDDQSSSVPFFGIAAADANLWAVGIDGIYRIDRGGVTKISSLPDFQQIGSVSVSFALPHVVLVLTEVNKRRSVSGSAPMIVAR